MRRKLFAAVAAFLLLASMSLVGTPALAAQPIAYSGPYVLLDAKTGDVYADQDALRPWYPASTTKLMTAWVVFRAIEAGELTLKSPVIMSKTAYGEPYASQFFKPGQVLTVDNALKVMLTRSANDMATAIAESVGGGYDDFVQRMNIEARRLGMSRTRFVNPHGLHDPRQITSARDLALLTRAIMTRYPRYKHYFGIPAIQVSGATRRNTNLLIGRYRGASGMKTGYICDSGWNVVATARRGGRELIAVVLGARNAIDRAEQAAILLDAGFERGTGLFAGTRGDITRISSGSGYAEPANMRPIVCGGGKANKQASPENPIYKSIKGGPILIDTGEGFKPSHIGERHAGLQPVAVAAGGVAGEGTKELGRRVVIANIGVLPRPRPTVIEPFSPRLATAFAPREAAPEPIVDPASLLNAPSRLPRPRPQP
ncbi:D-alanyl-D-alanine carboxypeptidase family protein [Afifella pfennigii]|uniref:D-alanyl-D-alanine carboxypeptidase family protein n=1 Tax=Afifella pfennigii TaxID=209897 RepID=UPI00068C86C0|nr:D-alanyl-D-alanine carboxypeptidase family protein [Afifella pfennigii]